MSRMTVQFPGGKKVDAHYNGFTIRTDQSPRGGGEGSAPQPFDLFLASLATCAGIYVKGFCDARGIGTEGLRLEMEILPDPQRPRIGGLDLHLHLPPGFPAQHVDAVVRAAGHCAVKQALQEPPRIQVLPHLPA